MTVVRLDPVDLIEQREFDRSLVAQQHFNRARVNDSHCLIEVMVGTSNNGSQLGLRVQAQSNDCRSVASTCWTGGVQYDSI